MHRSSEAATYQAIVQKWVEQAENAHKGGTIDKWPLGTRRKGEDPSVCAVFVTTKRDVGVQYIDVSVPFSLLHLHLICSVIKLETRTDRYAQGTIASALHGLVPTERRLLDLRVYYSNLDPTQHPSYGGWIHNITDLQFSPRDIADDDLLSRMTKLAEAQNFHAKSGLDYSLVLQNCLDNSTAPYIAIFEGDIQLAESWFARVLWALKQAEVMMQDKRWLLMRLFNEERASGFSSRHPLGNNVPLIILLINLPIIFMSWNLRRLAKRFGWRKVDWITTNFVLVLTLFTIPAFTILFFQTGKATVLPPAPGLRIENYGCCTQGMVYPRSEVGGLIDALRNRAEEENYDVIMDDYSWKGGVKDKEGKDVWLDHLALYPMMAQHLGFKSVISPERFNDQQIWSMAYEDLIPARLWKDHEALVKGMFGEGAWVDNRP